MSCRFLSRNHPKLHFSLSPVVAVVVRTHEHARAVKEENVFQSVISCCFGLADWLASGIGHVAWAWRERERDPTAAMLGHRQFGFIPKLFEAFKVRAKLTRS